MYSNVPSISIGRATGWLDILIEHADSSNQIELTAMTSTQAERSQRLIDADDPQTNFKSTDGTVVVESCSTASFPSC